jgi:hypothetical protein
MLRRRLVRVGFVVVLMSAIFAGSAIARQPGPIGFPLVPAVQATVKDACTGASVAGFVASLVDENGGSSAPSKATTGGFQFLTLPDASSLTLRVSAPGYDPLGDPAAPGVPVLKDPGPPGRVTKNPGPIGLPGQTRVFEGSQWAIGLMPLAGCAVPRPAKPATVTAKFFDLGTGAPIMTGTVTLVPNTPGVPAPAPMALTNGQMKASGLACGAYTLNLDAPGYAPPPPNSIAFMQHGQPCDTAPVSGAATISSVLVVAVPPTLYNNAPVIDTITADNMMLDPSHNPTVGAIVYAHDPDPGETALLTYNWTVTPSTGVDCSVIGSSTGTAAAIGCTGGGNATIKITVTDPHGASASSSFTVMVV